MKTKLAIAAVAGIIASSASSVSAEEKIDFETQIYPFVKSGCVKCHRPPYDEERNGRTRTRKPKGGYILATKEGIMSAETDDGAKFVVPGKPDDSRMLAVTLLPIDHDDHYPPEGKAPQWTDAEKELFAKWIEQGAEFGEWTEDPEPSEGLEWDGEEKAPGTVETAKAPE